MKRQRKSVTLQVRVLPQEQQVLVAIAAREGLRHKSEALRQVIREAAQRRGIVVETSGGAT